MTLREFYKATGGDYSDVSRRLGSDELIKRFVLKFRNDNSMSEIKFGLATSDRERAFRAAHTLKGLCLNLSFGNLCTAASALTERLRSGSTDGCEKLLAAVERKYKALILAISDIT